MLPFLPIIAITGSVYSGISFYKKRAKKIKSTSPDKLDNQQIITQKEKEINRDLALSLITLPLTGGKLIGLPWLIVPGILIEAYLFLPFIKRGYRELIKEKKIGVCVLDAVVSLVMFGLGYFFVSALFFIFYNSSQKLLLKTQEKSQNALINILGETPHYVWLVKDGSEVEIAFENIQEGDVLNLHAGEMIPVDGLITEGVASIDQHVLTGESQPTEKSIGDTVFAGTFLLSGKLSVSVEKSGTNTVAAQIGIVLNNTVDFKSSLQTKGEEFADNSALPTLAISAITLPLLGTASAATVLLASFGYNMRLVAPISILNSLKATSKQGILVKDGRALESLSNVDTIVFDKTGTLTQEQPHIGQIYTATAYDENEVLAFAACAEYKQTHPIAKAILDEAQERQISLDTIDNASYEVGYGLKVQSGLQSIRVGSFRFMEMENIAVPEYIEAIKSSCDEQGYSLLYIAVDDEFAGAIELHPTLRPQIKEVIDQLHQRKLKTYIISGDNTKPTQKLAEELSIDAYFAEVLPEDKANLIRDLQQQGKTVCFVGDGINDSIALKQADVSISLSGASTIATDTAQIILMDSGLNHLPWLFDFSNELDNNLRRGFALTVIPGVICIGSVYLLHFGVLAASLLYNAGLASGVTNAMLLKQKDPKLLKGKK